jgi:hypothetical protein
MSMAAKKIILIFVGLDLLLAASIFFSSGLSIQSLQTVARFSERLSLLLFSAIFLLYSKPAILTAWLSGKPYLLFAIVYGIYIVELVAFLYLAPMDVTPLNIVSGALSCILIFTMPVVLQYHNIEKTQPGGYATFETIYVYCLWLMFFLTYLARVQGRLPLVGGTFSEHVALLGWVSTLLGMKLAGLIQFKRSPPH